MAQCPVLCNLLKIHCIRHHLHSIPELIRAFSKRGNRVVTRHTLKVVDSRCHTGQSQMKLGSYFRLTSSSLYCMNQERNAKRKKIGADYRQPSDRSDRMLVIKLHVLKCFQFKINLLVLNNFQQSKTSRVAAFEHLPPVLKNRTTMKIHTAMSLVLQWKKGLKQKTRNMLVM